MTKNKNTTGYPGFRAWGIFVFTFLMAYPVLSQKVLKKTWNAQEFQQLTILAPQAYRLEVNTYAGSEISIELHSEGEHSDQIVLNTEINEGTLSVRPSYQPFFHAPNDKLAAHKVISIAIYVVIPENYRVIISAPKAHFYAEGSFQSLLVTLETGNCFLKNFKGDADLRTELGTIEVLTLGDTKGTAHSKEGEVLNRLPKEGFYLVKAQSVKGDISLLKTPE